MGKWMKLRPIAKLLLSHNGHTRISCWFPVVFALALSACMGNTTAPKPTYYYTLDYPPPSVQIEHQLPAVLRVERFAVSPPFHTQRIIYAGKGNHRNHYAYHQWIAAPGELLPYFLSRDLRDTNGFKAVLTPGSSLYATHSLHGWVEEFVERDGSKNCTAEATIHISLIDNMKSDPTAKVMLQKRYQASSQCSSKTPSALAESMSKAVAGISSDIARDIHHRLSSAGTLKY